MYTLFYTNAMYSVVYVLQSSFMLHTCDYDGAWLYRVITFPLLYIDILKMKGKKEENYEF